SAPIRVAGRPLRLADDEPVRPQRRASVAPNGGQPELRGDGPAPRNAGRGGLQPGSAQDPGRRVRVYGVSRWPGDHEGDQRRGQGVDAVCELRWALSAITEVLDWIRQIEGWQVCTGRCRHLPEAGQDPRGCAPGKRSQEMSVAVERKRKDRADAE